MDDALVEAPLMERGHRREWPVLFGRFTRLVVVRSTIIGESHGFPQWYVHFRDDAARIRTHGFHTTGEMLLFLASLEGGQCAT